MRWNLKMLLYKRNVTQAQLAEAAGVSAAWMSYFIKGYKMPSVKVMKRIADYLEVTVDELIKLSEQEKSA